jgi:hypothetical protein
MFLETALAMTTLEDSRSRDWYSGVISSSRLFALDLISLFFPLGRAQSCSNGLWARAMNSLKPDQMTASERLDEISQILAAGLTRLRARQSSALPADFGESSLHCAAPQSGHANVLRGELE